MALATGWLDGEGREIMQQDLVAALIPQPHGECALEVQLTFRPSHDLDAIELGKTNFGFLAVRVAKSLSAHFGGGQLTNSEGSTSEAGVFGKRARWMDYSGPVFVGTGNLRTTVVEGITYFDHPANPRYPTRWHVREDGWMGASFNMDAAYSVTHEHPLVLRYLLHAHRGAYDQARATTVHDAFAKRPGFVVRKSAEKHQQFSVGRSSEESVTKKAGSR